MGNKNKTVSFRVNEETFERLRQVAEEQDLSLSAVFREYVDTFVAHEGQVRVVPENPIGDPDAGFPPSVEVPTSFIRDHERLELEAEHLREQLEEYKRYVNGLREELEGRDEDVVYLEDLDEELAGDEPYQFG